MTRTRITTDGLTDASVTTQKIAPAAITTDRIAPGAVVEADLADSSVTTSKIAPGAVTASRVTLVPADIGAAPASHTHPSTAISDSTSAGRALLTGADAAAQRTSLGLGTMAQATATDYLARAGGTMTGQLVATAGTAAAPGVAISGDTNTGIAQAGGADTLGVVTGGVERVRVGSDSSLSAAAVGDTNNTLRPAGFVRAWARFNATGTSPITPIRSFNVTSVTRVVAGVFNINLTSPLSSNNGVAVASGVSSDTATDLGTFNNMANALVINSTTARVAVLDISNVFQENSITSVIICDL
jgi:hypothetical protein